MAIVDYTTFITECLSVDGFPDRADGWILKHKDTGAQYLRVLSVWEPLGLGLSFAPPTKSGIVTTSAAAVASIVFGTPFIDDNYGVALTCNYPGGNQPPIALVTAKTATGFSIQTVFSRTGNNSGNTTVSWHATRSHNE